MDKFLNDITSLNLAPVEMCAMGEDGVRVVDGSYLVSNDGATLQLRVVRGDVASQLVYVHGVEAEGVDEVQIEIERGASLSLVEVIPSGVVSRLNFAQAADSQLKATVVQLGDCEFDCCVQLVGEGGECRVDILQMTTSEEKALCDLRVEHIGVNCVSRTTSKAIAGGASTSSFNGMVYVAQGAQCTEAYQNSRNIALTPEARIVAEPQLEIYADDVKCSHGATVGQMNRDAIFYMCQRGLSEQQARKVQLEGFANQLAQESPIEECREALVGVISDRLNDL